MAVGGWKLSLSVDVGRFYRIVVMLMASIMYHVAAIHSQGRMAAI